MAERRVEIIRLTQAIVAVMACTMASGVAGGVVGAAVGRLAPSFVTWLAAPGRIFGPPPLPFDPTEFGFGLGTVSGLFLGAGTGLFLVSVLSLRDAWLARAGLHPAKARREFEPEHSFD
jgi:hypothetical protein